MASPNSQTSTPTQNLSTQQAIRLLAQLKGWNLNAIADTAVPILNATKYSVKNYVVCNSSMAATVTVATFGIFTAPGSAGTAILSVTNASALTASTTVVDAASTSTAAETAQVLYMRCILAQGAAETCDIALYGYDIS